MLQGRSSRAGAVLIAAMLSLGACTIAPQASDPPTASLATATGEPMGGPLLSASSTQLPDDGLPGEIFTSGLSKGDELAVFGVAVGDVLNVRGGPGVDFPVVGELQPMDTAEMTGNGRIVDGSVWVEVAAGGVTGWAYMGYLAYLGDVSDATSELGDVPTGNDVTALAGRVVDQFMAEVPRDWYDVVTVDGPHQGDVADVTVDVVGFGDDSVLGTRVHVVAGSAAGGLTVTSVERTLLCARGTADGRCI